MCTTLVHYLLKHTKEGCVDQDHNGHEISSVPWYAGKAKVATPIESELILATKND